MCLRLPVVGTHDSYDKGEKMEGLGFIKDISVLEEKIKRLQDKAKKLQWIVKHKPKCSNCQFISSDFVKDAVRFCKFHSTWPRDTFYLDAKMLDEINTCLVFQDKNKKETEND